MKFDELLNRKGSDCIKWDYVEKVWGRDDLMPLWVADMDFRSPDFVMEEIQRMLSYGVLGYTGISQRWYDAILNWYGKRYSELKQEELCFIPGIVRGISFAVNVFTKPGDKVLVMNPVYHPFFLVAQRNDREVVFNSLILNEQTHQYDIDFDALDAQMQGCKLFVFCNPHNPGGRVWSVEELKKVAQIAAKNNCLVISDEIHSDLTLPGYVHHPFFTVSEEAAQNSIIFNAPSKAFNIPGIISSYCIIKNPEIRSRFKKFLDAGELDSGNMFTYNSCAACYEKGEAWLNEMLTYIVGNIDYVEEYLAENIPGVSMIRPQASYLIYLDCRGLELDQEKLVDLFVDKAHLALNDGAMFGTEGKGFMRLNVGCPRSMLTIALGRLESAVKNL